jgi:hypothetical protein
MFYSSAITHLNLDNTPALKSKLSNRHFGVIQQALINNRARATDKDLAYAA